MRPVDMWSGHAVARRRGLLLTRARAHLSLAGFRDRLMMRHLSRLGPYNPRRSTAVWDESPLRRPLRILDVGCGGGRPLLTRFGLVVGAEPDERLAAEARQLYFTVHECRAQAMPFGDGIFDAVVSTDILGHIPLPEKDAAIREMHRVTRPGGLAIHVAEADGDCWYLRRAKAEPEAYSRAMVDECDHVGLEPAGRLVSRFSDAGYWIEEARPVQSVVMECGMVSAVFKYHRRLPAWLRAYCAADRALARWAVLREIVNVSLRPTALLDSWAPLQSSCFTIVARKPNQERKSER